VGRRRGGAELEEKDGGGGQRRRRGGEGGGRTAAGREPIHIYIPPPTLLGFSEKSIAVVRTLVIHSLVWTITPFLGGRSCTSYRS